MMPRNKQDGSNISKGTAVEEDTAHKPLRRSTRNLENKTSSEVAVEKHNKKVMSVGGKVRTGKAKEEKTIMAKHEEIIDRPKKRRKVTATASAQTKNEPKEADHVEKHSRETRDEPTKSQGSIKNYWLLKAEPDSRIEKGVDVKFSIDDLQACTKPEPWEGVRNHVAKNNMKAMKRGELAFFYHSNTKVPGIAGVMEIAQESSIDYHPDHMLQQDSHLLQVSALDPKHPYHDPKSDPDNPKWFHVHVAFQRKFPNLITLRALQSHKGPGKALEHMQLLKQSRLSVSKVSVAEWEFIIGLADVQGA